MPIMMLAADANVDTGVVTELINLTKSVMGLFTTYPINIYLIAGLAVAALSIFMAAKNAVGH